MKVIATLGALLPLLGLCIADGCYLECQNDKCLQAIKATPAIGSSLCTTTIPYSPTTTTVVTTVSACTTQTSFIEVPEVITSSVTVSTVTVVRVTTSEEPTVTITFKKRDAVACTSKIMKECHSNDKRISSACYCFLGGVAPTSTVTSTAYADCSSITEITTTRTVVSTVTDTAITGTSTRTVPTQGPVLENPGFDDGPTLGPWRIFRDCDYDRSDLGDVQRQCGTSLVEPDANAPSSPNSFHFVNYKYWEGSQDTHTLYQEMQNLQEDVDYQVSFDYRAINTSPGSVQMFVNAGQDELYTATLAETNGWTTLVAPITFRLPLDNNLFSVTLTFLGPASIGPNGPPPSFEVFFDNFSIVQV